MAERLGIQSPLQPYPSAVLGTNDVTADGHGLRLRHLRQPRRARAARCSSPGSPAPTAPSLYEHEHTQEKVIDADVADTVSAILQQVIAAGHRHAGQARPAGGRARRAPPTTTATPGSSGYTPELSTAVWVGLPGGASCSMRPPATPIKVFGGTYPARDLAAVHEHGAGRAARRSPFPRRRRTTTTLPPYVAPPPTSRRRGPATRRARTWSGMPRRGRHRRPSRRPGFAVEPAPVDGNGPSRRARWSVQSPAAGASAPRGSTGHPRGRAPE